MAKTTVTCSACKTSQRIGGADKTLRCPKCGRVLVEGEER